MDRIGEQYLSYVFMQLSKISYSCIGWFNCLIPQVFCFFNLDNFYFQGEFCLDNFINNWTIIILHFYQCISSDERSPWSILCNGINIVYLTGGCGFTLPLICTIDSTFYLASEWPLNGKKILFDCNPQVIVSTMGDCEVGFSHYCTYLGLTCIRK